ncbi:flagellar biosynthetic protein FliO [Pseudomonas syringae]|uniref:Flagellar protein n=1 Tax=Pseudomonas syringae TaxID=317 RepID=A0A085VQS9_PSESX|nr:flagellar biosynthetic protein FliO [Pseudomonas syringae]KFE57792.1 flagellar assembly protein FliO [Pseudomonas syringae]
MFKSLVVLLAMPLYALAAEPAAQAVAPAANVSLSSGMGGQLMQLLFGLLLVVGLIFALAWLMRRVQRGVPGNGQVIELVGSRAIGPRDRLVLVQVGDEQILLGVTPGRITPLHVLKEPVQVPERQPVNSEFAQRLMDLMGNKVQKDKK